MLIIFRVEYIGLGSFICHISYLDEFAFYNYIRLLHFLFELKKWLKFTKHRFCILLATVPREFYFFQTTEEREE